MSPVHHGRPSLSDGGRHRWTTTLDELIEFVENTYDLETRRAVTPFERFMGGAITGILVAEWIAWKGEQAWQRTRGRFTRQR